MDLLSDFLCQNFNILSCLKLADKTPLYQKGKKNVKKTIDLLAFCQH